jgi:hypothetical protein
VIWIEDGAGLVVRELLEEDSGFVVLVEDSGAEVAGKPWIEAGERVGYSFVDACGFLWVGLFESGEAFVEACSVFVGDGEDADATLRAARMADKVCAAALVGVGYGSINDLDEGLRHESGDGLLGCFALEGRLLCAGEGVFCFD